MKTIMRFAVAFFALNGCGRGSDVSLGGGVDATPDTDAELTSDGQLPSKGAASVTVQNFLGPLPGLDVLFYDAGGQLQAKAQTDSKGRASAEVTPDSQVTVASFGIVVADEYELVTVLNVQPGDDIVLDGGGDPTLNGVVTTANISLPVIPGSLSAAATYYVATCASSTGGAMNTLNSIKLPVQKRCVGTNGKFRVFGELFNTQGLRIGFAWTEVSATGNTTFANPSGWHDEYSTLPISVSNLPADASARRVSVGRSGQGVVSASDTLEDDFAASLRVPMIPGDGLERNLFVGWFLGAEGSYSQMTEDQDAGGSQVVFDGEKLLPRVSAVSVDGASTPQRVYFSASGDLSDADAVQVMISWEDAKRHTWKLFGPPHSHAPLALPVLPEEMTAWSLSPKTTTNLSVTFWDSEAVNGYNEVRGRPSLVFQRPSGTDGKFRATQGWK